MIEQVTQTENGYHVTIDGQDIFVPNDPANEDYQRVKAALDGGMKLNEPLEPSAANVLAAKIESAVAELAAEVEQKRLDAIKESVRVEFKDAKSGKDVSAKLVQIKAARKSK